jgi:hypothetical protein
MIAALQKAGIDHRIVFSAAQVDGAIAAAKAGLGCIALLRSNVSPPLRALEPDAGLPPLFDLHWGVYLNEGTRSDTTEQLAHIIAKTIAPSGVAA